MTDAELAALLEDFQQRYEAGGRPDPADYLVRAGGDADDFAELLDRYLSASPAPVLLENELEILASSPVFAAPPWSKLLVEARERQGILRSDVVARLTEALGLRATQRERVAEHLHDLETGSLAPRLVSSRVVGALDGIFSGIGAALERTRLIEPPTPIQSASFARDALAAVMASPAPPSRADAEVDALFLGGEDER